MAGWGDVIVCDVEGPDGEGLKWDGGCKLVEMLRYWVCTGVAIGFDFGGGVPATVCRIVMDFWAALAGSGD